MPSETLFVSDLHLTAARPDITLRFLNFLDHRAKGADRLYILGDLFNAYLGDDDNASPNREVKAALRRLFEEGTAIFFQHGNRDFLLGQGFCRDTGVLLLGDYELVDLYGDTAVVTHGDLLCTDDLHYQAARIRVRTEQWKRHALAKPLLLRRLYGRWYRFKSGLDKEKKTMEIMDANGQAVVDTFRKFDVNFLIHGHTHRPAIQQMEVDDKRVQRIVLAEWNTRGQVLSWRESGQFAFETLE